MSSKKKTKSLPELPPIHCVLCKSTIPDDEHVVDEDGIYIAESATKPVCMDCAVAIVGAVVKRTEHR